MMQVQVFIQERHYRVRLKTLFRYLAALQSLSLIPASVCVVFKIGRIKVV